MAGVDCSPRGPIVDGSRGYMTRRNRRLVVTIKHIVLFFHSLNFSLEFRNKPLRRLVGEVKTRLRFVSEKLIPQAGKWKKSVQV
jgi:hypothetical protein